MSHLTLETLARLIDETPDPTENGHLDNCKQCREELESMRADAAALRSLEDPEPPLVQWIRLEQRLEREGLMKRTWRWQATMLRAAAAVVIFVLGGVSASLLMRSGPRDYLTQNDTVRAQPVQQMAPATNPAATLAGNVTTPGPVVAAPGSTALPPARTAEEAAARLRSAETDYLTALTRYTELAGRSEQGDPLARLAALESIVATTRAALERAPADQVINGYHLT
ncbi:MAG TPA: hypothetical protein VFZ04_17115, partial [Longimicrobiales bacterium]